MDNDKMIRDFEYNDERDAREEAEFIQELLQTGFITKRDLCKTLDEELPYINADETNPATFAKKYYYGIKGKYSEYEYTISEQESLGKYFEEHGFIADLMDSRQEVSSEMIYEEFNRYAKGFEEEKKKLAELVWRFYLVRKTKEYCYASHVFEDVIGDKRITKFHDITKYVLCEMFWGC